MRPLEPHEMEKLTELWVAFMQDPVATEFIPDCQSTSRWQEYATKHLEEDPRQVLVAELEGKLVGYLLYRSRSDFPVTRRYDHATIADIYVLPEHRRQGIGTKLMETCLHHLREVGATHVRLRVSARNETALSLYRKQGFVTHDLVMQLQLQI